ncbi:hypothetical protein CI109_103575 [Kwoniella shandongensis]|uniref:DUF202 domain-containing protein n=1 Tax=Kwoniella shandongensis TaxID=1734106 RepID=A0AAJ8LJY1_9TREE
MDQLSKLFYQPFSATALKLLPKKGVGMRAKSKRADRIPDDPQRPLVTDYHSINDPTIRIRVPKAKVWFANERTFISYLSMGILLSTIASGLLFGAKDSSARWFAFAYALIRLTMISARDAGSFARRQMGVNPLSFQNAWYQAGVKGAWIEAL